MWWLLVLVPFVALVVYVWFCVSERKDAREQAEEYITGTHLHAPAEIDLCIRRLETSNHRLLSKNKADLSRIARLQRIRHKGTAPRD